MTSARLRSSPQAHVTKSNRAKNARAAETNPVDCVDQAITRVFAVVADLVHERVEALDRRVVLPSVRIARKCPCDSGFFIASTVGVFIFSTVPCRIPSMLLRGGRTASGPERVWVGRLERISPSGWMIMEFLG